MSTKADRIQGQIHGLELILDCLGHFLGLQDTLIGCAGFIIPFLDPSTKSFFTNQFHNRLEEIEIQAQDLIQVLQLAQGLGRVVAIIAYRATDYRPILLFDVGLIVFLVGSTPSESDVLCLAVATEMIIDELREFLEPSRFREEPVELLTLSACQTAIGDDRAALGLAGVAIKAGARSALASLWFVEDEATSQLMKKFYQNLEKADNSKILALQLAQVSLMQEKKFQHPAFWAPFILIGNWL